MKKLIVCFLIDQRGHSAIEYAMVASLISTFMIGALQMYGYSVFSLFDTIGSSIDDSAPLLT